MDSTQPASGPRSLSFALRVLDRKESPRYSDRGPMLTSFGVLWRYCGSISAMTHSTRTNFRCPPFSRRESATTRNVVESDCPDIYPGFFATTGFIISMESLNA